VGNKVESISNKRRQLMRIERAKLTSLKQQLLCMRLETRRQANGNASRDKSRYDTIHERQPSVRISLLNGEPPINQFRQELNAIHCASVRPY